MSRLIWLGMAAAALAGGVILERGGLRPEVVGHDHSSEPVGSFFGTYEAKLNAFRPAIRNEQISARQAIRIAARQTVLIYSVSKNRKADDPIPPIPSRWTTPITDDEMADALKQDVSLERTELDLRAMFDQKKISDRKFEALLDIVEIAQLQLDALNLDDSEKQANAVQVANMTVQGD